MSKPFSIIIIELGDDATHRLTSWRQTLLKMASKALPGMSAYEPLEQEMRGAATVATMAEVERLLRESLVELSLDINRAGVPISALTPGLRALASDAHFNAISMSAKGEQHWDNRAIVTRLETNTQIASFPRRTASGPQPPLDGKTIRAVHFKRIWAVLDLEGLAVPSAEMEASLNAMSTMRNDVAHGNAPLSEIFHEQVHGKSSEDIAQHILHIVRLIDHFCLSLSDYVTDRKFRVV